MKPGADALAQIAAKHVPRDARVLHLTEANALAGAPPESLDAIVAAWPSAHGALMPLFASMARALRPGGLAIVCDLVWQTAPTIELLRAFAPAPGREKVRPVEGYEMQVEHTGFEVVERAVIDPARWLPGITAEQRAAAEADTRGAARLAAWVLRRASDE